jgi:ATP-dependent RNA helicase SUPV3L1/SUV3
MCEQRITAVLGPTNTGKTHLAVERMLAIAPASSACRCACSRARSMTALSACAARPRWRWSPARNGSCPSARAGGSARSRRCRRTWRDFLAIDEIQLCADPERGHVFTDRLLHARGLRETMFLGAATMRGAIAALVPGVARFEGRSRFSELTYTGFEEAEPDETAGRHRRLLG